MKRHLRFKDLYASYYREMDLILEKTTLERQTKVYIKHLSKLDSYRVDQLAPLEVQHVVLNTLYNEEKFTTLVYCIRLITQVMNFGIATKAISENPIDTLRYLPLVKRAILKSKADVRHRATFDYEKLDKELLQLLKVFKKKGNLRQNLLLELSLRTLLRPIEVVSLRFSNFDKKKHILTVVKTKTKNIFKIPLTDSFENCICIAYENFGCPINDWIFKGVRNKNQHLSAQTLNKALKTYGYKNKLVAHGIRSIGANFFARNAKKVHFWIAAACLQHVVGSPVERVYRKDDYILERKKAMKLWNEYLDRLYSEI